MVFLLKPDSAPKDLVCSICMSVPLKPCSLRTCEHVFCEDCIQESQRHSRACPVDRKHFHPTDVRSFQEGSLAFRIWSSILIKCDFCEVGCGWTGSIADYYKHRNSCDNYRKQKRSDEDERLIEKLKEENEDLTAQNQNLMDEVEDLQDENEDLTYRLAASIREVANCQMQNQCLTEKLEQSKRGSTALTSTVEILAKTLQTKLPRVDEGYTYNRYDVVKLTKLICHDLESKPSSTDANKIFNCVRRIYLDMKRGYNDNPPHMYIDVRMLVSVCLASTWFTTNQKNNLRGFATEQGWN